MSQLEEFHADSVNNFATSKDRLGDTLTLAEDVADLYSCLGSCVIAAPDQNEAHAAATTFILACRLELFQALAAVMQGHVTDSGQSIRRAVELCGFGYLVHRDPTLAYTWLNSTRGPDENRAYRRAFSIANAVPNNVPWMHRLYRYYDIGSRQSHPTPQSLARRVGVERMDGRLEFSMKTHELTDENPDWVVVEFLRIIKIHHLIIDSFYRMFSDTFGAEKKGDFDRLGALLVRKYDFHQSYWRQHVPEMLRLARGQEPEGADSNNSAVDYG